MALTPNTLRRGASIARRLGVFCGLLVLNGGTTSGQDVKTVLQRVAKNIGADNLKCLSYSGTGYVGLVGQNFSLRDDWPQVELSSYDKAVDFNARSAREERVIRQGKYPARGGGGIPIQGEQRQIALVSGNYAWNMQGNSAIPTLAAAGQRQLDILLTPHGFIKAAMAASDTVVFTRHEGGEGGGAKRLITVVSFTALGKYRVTASINNQNLVERVQTWIPNPVAGDMNYETVYDSYKDFGGVKFPTHFHHHDDWDDNDSGFSVSGGRNSFDLNVTGVQPNVCGEAVAVPEAVQKATIPPVRVESQKMADGVYLFGGGSHNSVAVEFRDFVAVIEAPLDEERSLAVISEVQRLIPNKPINYVVNTHHHYDHSGGLRTYIHDEGSVIITHVGNREFYGREVFSLLARRTLQPDRLSLYPPEEAAEGYRFETVIEKYTLSDATRNLDVHHIQGLAHADGMLIAHLPKERIVVEADMYDPPSPNAPVPKAPSASEQTFYDNVQRLKLDISTIVPIHGRAVPWADFLKIFGATPRGN